MRHKRPRIKITAPTATAEAGKPKPQFKWLKNNSGTFLGALDRQTGLYWVKMFANKNQAETLCKHIRSKGFVGMVTNDIPFKITIKSKQQ